MLVKGGPEHYTEPRKCLCYPKKTCYIHLYVFSAPYQGSQSPSETDRLWTRCSTHCRYKSLYSLSVKMAYIKISWSLNAMRLDVDMIIYLICNKQVSEVWIHHYMPLYSMGCTIHPIKYVPGFFVTHGYIIHPYHFVSAKLFWSDDFEIVYIVMGFPPLDCWRVSY